MTRSGRETDHQLSVVRAVTLTGAEDPTETATELATWVTTYGVDGVDIDFEDITSTTTWGQKAEWMITFQQTLRSLLPAST